MAALSIAEWEGILDHVRCRHANLTRLWFNELSCTALHYGVLHVECANAPQQRYLNEHCVHAFVEAAQVKTGRLVSVRFRVSGQDGPSAPGGAAPESPLAESHRPPLGLNPSHTFDQFVTGPSNRLAHAASVAVSNALGEAYNPLFIHGNVGLGKTHLLQAICHQIAAHRPGAQTIYLSCETFINHFIEAVERGALERFRYRYRYADALLIDDIQFLAERERSQEEFFHTFNTLHQSRKQIVLSADCSPCEIPSLADRLVSRFNWGLVTRIDQPCLETRMVIVHKKARLRQLELPEDVVHFIASHATSNARELEGAITTIEAYSQQLGREADLATAREALGCEEPDARQVSCLEIMEFVCRHYNIKKSEIQGHRRNKSVTLPRQVCMFLTRELTPHSLEEIGSFFGGRDHSTVIHSVRLIQRLQQQDPALSATVQKLRSHFSRQRRT